MENIVQDPIIYSSRSKKEMMVKLYANDKQSLFKFISFYINRAQKNVKSKPKPKSIKLPIKSK